MIGLLVDSIPAKTCAMHQSGDHSYDISLYIFVIIIIIIISKFLTKPVLVIPIPTAQHACFPLHLCLRCQ